MHECARLWVVLAGAAAPRPWLYAFRRRKVAALACATDPTARATASLLAEVTGARVQEDEDLGGPPELARRALARAAHQHPDQEVLVSGTPATLRAAIGAALALAADDPSARVLDLRTGGLYAFDWLAGSEAPPPVLVGADLDWLPPWVPGRTRPRFPGGPGAAGTARG